MRDQKLATVTSKHQEEINRLTKFYTEKFNQSLIETQKRDELIQQQGRELELLKNQMQQINASQANIQGRRRRENEPISSDQLRDIPSVVDLVKHLIDAQADVLAVLRNDFESKFTAIAASIDSIKLKAKPTSARNTQYPKLL